MYFKGSLAAALLFSLLISGCASLQPKIDMDPKFWGDKNQTIGVAVAKLPKPSSFKSGNQGLLDILINDANSSDLDTHLASLDTSSVFSLQDKLVNYLHGKNIKAEKIDGQFDPKSLPELTSDEDTETPHAKRDYKKLKDQLHVDKLLLISVTRLGTMRSYYGFIPTSDPVGSSIISGKIINLSDNSLEWSQIATQNVPNSDGDWDTPPDFPGLTKAVFSAYDQSQQMLLNKFMQ